MFQSFFQGGFDCAAHRRRDRRQVDVLRATNHDVCAEHDYGLLALAGMRTVRDGLAWHRIEKRPGVYDWSSFLPMLDAALRTGTQVIWDLCHWGVPAGLNLFGPDFVPRFAEFAGAVARLVFQQGGGAAGPVPWYCPVNEMSFWSWVGGEAGVFSPHVHGRGYTMKQRLVEASLAAMEQIREVDPRARFLQAEPMIDIGPDWRTARRWPHRVAEAAGHTAAQFQAWDMLSGERDPGLGGTAADLDVLGVNYYWDSQWVHHGERKPLGHPGYKPVHHMLLEIYERYGRPILVSETGAEGSADVGWLGYMAAEVRQARREGADVVGICMYPVMDYPGWDDGRHVRCGLIAVDDDWEEREVRTDLVKEIRLQARMMEEG